MATFDINVTGIEEACAALTELPNRMVKNTFAKALAASAVPIVEAMEARCPVDTGDLKQHIQTKIGINSDGKGGSVDVGFFSTSITVTDALGKKHRRQDAGAVSVSRFVEYGHRQVSHATKAALEGQAGKDSRGRTIKHKYRALLAASGASQVQPHPFMRPALITSADEAVEAFVDSVAASVIAEDMSSQKVA